MAQKSLNGGAMA